MLRIREAKGDLYVALLILEMAVDRPLKIYIGTFLTKDLVQGVVSMHAVRVSDYAYP